MGVVEGNKSASDNDWEKITKGGDKAIQKWIDEQLIGKSCNIVLIGENTAGRKWINYEIKSAWDSNKGVVGVYIHRLKDLGGNYTPKGRNPFDVFAIGEKRRPMASVVKAYSPPYSESKDVYSYIREHLADWIEEAIEIRNTYTA
jgi:hypothetical protein